MFASVILKNTGNASGWFDYTVPPDLENIIQTGDLVEVPFRDKITHGIVWSMQNKSEAPVPKTILALRRSETVRPWQHALAQWIAEYYHAPLVKVADIMVPEKIWNDTFDPSLHKQRTISPGLVKAKSKNEQALAQILLGEKEMKYEALRAHMPSLTPALLKKMANKGIIEVREGCYETPYFKNRINETSFITHHFPLTSSQQKALDIIIGNWKLEIGNTVRPCLLFGPAASGKTEVYVRLAQRYAEQGKQTLILVPEIALTPQLVQHFTTSFGRRIAVIHSQLSDTERCIEWERLRTGEAQIAIGSRIALFAPFYNLGCVCVDEEHEWTYKSEQTPRYHARDVAVKLGEILNIPVILGSATPSIESFTYAKVGRYVLVRLERIAEETSAVETRRVRLKEKPSVHIETETDQRPVSTTPPTVSLEPSKKFLGKYRIESTRLKGWDYSSEGAYFVTICTKDRKHLFGEIRDGEMRENEKAKICRRCWDDLPNHYQNCALDEFVIMPNHVHGMIRMEHHESGRDAPLVRLRGETDQRPVSTKRHSLADIICAFKAYTTKKIHLLGHTNFAWQPRFYDHIIRDEESLYQIREYIRDNPKNWDKDRENNEGLRM